MNIFDYQNALDYLYSFIDYSLTRNLRYAEEKFDLSRMNLLMNLLGNPQNNLDIIHVAGTKGKGSTCAMIASILQAQGYRVGFYSSPHMIDFRERIQINNEYIQQHDFVSQINSMKETIESVKNVSTFEITTALAMKYFVEKNVDIAVLEVGMGGRLDATNIVDPIISVITSISLDHTKILGDTIPKIAQEKAGIIKENVPVVIGRQVPEAKKVLLNIAKKRNSRIIDISTDYQWKQLDYSLKSQRFLVKIKNQGKEETEEIEVKMSLVGDHQIDNALTAIAAVEHLPKKYRVSTKCIQEGLLNAYWPGRFEFIYEHPMIIIDGAHNPDSFEKLARTIDKYLPKEKIKLVFGASEDKNIAEMISIIAPFVDSFIFTKSDHPRAMNEVEIKENIPTNFDRKFIFRDIDILVSEMLQDKDSIYIATGSIFIAGAVRELVGSIN